MILGVTRTEGNAALAGQSPYSRLADLQYLRKLTSGQEFLTLFHDGWRYPNAAT